MTSPSTVLRDNRTDLVHATVSGRIAPPRIFSETPAINHDGRHVCLPGSGGIALGVHVGDPVHRWLADHLMPGASIEDAEGNPAVAGPLHLLSCVGNAVRDGAGRKLGVVCGKRGGMAPGFWPPQLVSIEMPDQIAESLAPGDKVVVETVGRGLKLTDFPDVTLVNVSPALLDSLPIHIEAGKLICDVRALAFPESAGPGLGQDAWIGDLEIAADRLADGTMEDLRFGDLVAFSDTDSSTTRFYRPGWISIGLVSHGPSPAAGHGIGVTILLTAPIAVLGAHTGEGGTVDPSLRRLAELLCEE